MINPSVTLKSWVKKKECLAHFSFFFYFFLFFFFGTSAVAETRLRLCKTSRNAVRHARTLAMAQSRPRTMAGFDINLRAIYTIHSRPQQSQVKVSLVCVHDYHIVSNMKKRHHFLQKNELPGQVDAEMHTKVCSCQTVIHKMFYKITWFPVNPMCSENVQALPQDSDIRTHKFSVRP